MDTAAIAVFLFPASIGDLNFTRSRNAIKPTTESKGQQNTTG